MEGEPSFYGDAAGFNCFLDDQLDGAVYLRYFADPGAVPKVIDDWATAIDEAGAIAYSSNWLAVGPETRLEELLGPFEKEGPLASGPSPAPMSAAEGNRSVCSSIVYEVLLTSGSGVADSEVQTYFDAFPGMKSLRDAILTTDHISSLAEAAGGDDLRGIVYLTHFDDQIKSFCSDAGGSP